MLNYFTIVFISSFGFRKRASYVLDPADGRGSLQFTFELSVMLARILMALHTSKLNAYHLAKL